jgi:hypothetical protein
MSLVEDVIEENLINQDVSGEVGHDALYIFFLFPSLSIFLGQNLEQCERANGLPDNRAVHAGGTTDFQRDASNRLAKRLHHQVN